MAHALTQNTMPAETLNLAFEQLARIEHRGSIDAHANVFRVGNDTDHLPFQRKKLTNPEVRALNEIISYLTASNFDTDAAHSIMAGNASAAATALMESLGRLFHQTVACILHIPARDDSVFDDSRTIGYPISNIFDRLEEHKMRDGSYDNLWGEVSVDNRPPLWDWMFDDDPDIINAFLKLLLLINEVV